MGSFTGLGGGIMVVLAAGLWLVYLMPTLFKRREFVASERTEIRRQKALQVLQETSAVPAVVRARTIVSPNGEVTDRERLAEAIKRSKEAQAAREASRQFAEATRANGGATSLRARAARRLRRTRAVATLVLLAAFVAIVVQVVLMFATGIAVGAWAVLGFSVVLGIVAVAALGRLAAMSRRRAAAPVVGVAVKPVRTRVVEQKEAERPPVATWTPVPLPKPMYLSRSEAAPVAEVDHLEVLRAAARESDQALREAQTSPEVTPIAKREEPAVPSRFAAMGIVGQTDGPETDIDDILRRRRQAAAS